MTPNEAHVARHGRMEVVTRDSNIPSSCKEKMGFFFASNEEKRVLA